MPTGSDPPLHWTPGSRTRGSTPATVLEARGPGEHASSDRSLFPSLAPLLTPGLTQSFSLGAPATPVSPKSCLPAPPCPHWPRMWLPTDAPQHLKLSRSETAIFRPSKQPLSPVSPLVVGDITTRLSPKSAPLPGCLTRPASLFPHPHTCIAPVLLALPLRLQGRGALPLPRCLPVEALQLSPHHFR